MKVLIIDLIWQVFLCNVIKNKMNSAWKKNLDIVQVDIEKKQVRILLIYQASCYFKPFGYQ